MNVKTEMDFKLLEDYSNELSKMINDDTKISYEGMLIYQTKLETYLTDYLYEMALIDVQVEEKIQMKKSLTILVQDCAKSLIILGRGSIVDLRESVNHYRDLISRFQVVI
jgi:hypothetical protein